MSTQNIVGMRLPNWAQPREIFDLIRLATPVALSRSSFMLMSLTDSVVLARNEPGQLPFVLNAWLPLGVLLGFGMGLMVGVQVLTAELSGEKRGEETGRVFRRGMVFGTLYGLAGTFVCLLLAHPLFSLFGFDVQIVNNTVQVTKILVYGLVFHMACTACALYLEALRKPNIVTIVSMIAVVFNLIFDLIVVPQYGAVGVAWATTLSRVLMTLLFLVPIFVLTPALKSAGRSDTGEARRQNMVGVGTGVAHVAEWGGFNLTFVIATMVSIDAGTVYGLAIQFIAAIFMIYMGLGTATSVRVAEAVGRKDPSGVADASRLGMLAMVMTGVVLSALLWAFRHQLADIGLNASEPGSEGAHLAPLLAALITVSAMVSLFDGMQCVAAMTLRAQGVVWKPTFLQIAAFVLVMLPLVSYASLPFGWDMGVWGVMLGVCVGLGISGVGQWILLEYTLRTTTFPDDDAIDITD